VFEAGTRNSIELNGIKISSFGRKLK
jgi:hypothetical protein